MNDDSDRRHLIHDYFDGDLPADKVDEFASFLTTKPDSIRQFVEAGLVDYLLERHVLSQQDPEAQQFLVGAGIESLSDDLAAGVEGIHADRLQTRGDASTERHRARRFTLYIAAASILIALGVALVSGRIGTLYGRFGRGMDTSQTAEIVTGDEVVAHIARTDFVKWGGENKLDVGEGVAIGRSITIDSGLVELHLTRGADLILKGPAKLTFISPLHGTLESGTLTASVEETAQGLRIDTAQATIIDLGTEFGVSVTNDDETDVVVFKGEVVMSAARNPADPPRDTPRHLDGRILEKGDGLRIGAGGVDRLVAIDSSSYPREIANPGGSPDRQATVIRRVRDTLRESETAKCYRIVPHGLVEDAPAYVDRDHQWNGVDSNGIPKELINADYVMTFNEDKLVMNIEVDVWLGVPARLYLFVDDRVPPPDWLTRDFKDTELKIGLDEGGVPNPAKANAVGPGESIDTVSSVWMRDVTTAGKVSLGSLESSEPFTSMYGIAAKPL
jgi:FecR protein